MDIFSREVTARSNRCIKSSMMAILEGKAEIYCLRDIDCIKQDLTLILTKT